MNQDDHKSPSTDASLENKPDSMAEAIEHAVEKPASQPVPAEPTTSTPVEPAVTTANIFPASPQPAVEPQGKDVSKDKAVADQKAETPKLDKNGKPRKPIWLKTIIWAVISVAVVFGLLVLLGLAFFVRRKVAPTQQEKLTDNVRESITGIEDAIKNTPVGKKSKFAEKTGGTSVQTDTSNLSVNDLTVTMDEIAKAMRNGVSDLEKIGQTDEVKNNPKVKEAFDKFMAAYRNAISSADRAAKRMNALAPLVSAAQEQNKSVPDNGQVSADTMAAAAEKMAEVARTIKTDDTEVQNVANDIAASGAGYAKAVREFGPIMISEDGTDHSTDDVKKFGNAISKVGVLMQDVNPTKELESLKVAFGEFKKTVESLK